MVTRTVLLALVLAAAPDLAISEEYVTTTLGRTLRVTGPAAAPKVVRRVNPVIPDIVVKTRQSGMVKLAVLLDRNGKVAQVTVVEGPSNPLNQAAVTAVRQWRYKPVVVVGQAVPALIDVQFDFRF